MSGKKGLKVLLWIAAIAVVLILVLYAAVMILLPKDKIVELIIPRVEEALNRKVSVGDVDFTIWSGIGLRISDLAVKNPEGFQSANMIELGHLDVKVKFFPLLKKRVEVTKLILDGLTLHYETTKSGVSSFDDLGSAPGEGVERIEAEEAAAAIPFVFDDLEIVNSSIKYLDGSTGKSFSLDGLKMETTLVPEGRETLLRSKGELSVNDIIYGDGKKEYPIPEIDFKMQHDILYDSEADSMRFDELQFVLGELKGRIGGVATEVSKEPLLNLDFRTDDLKLKDVLDAVPAELFPQASEMKASGELHLVGTYRGPARLTRTAELEGKLTMSDIELAHEEYKGKLKMELAELNFTQRNITFYSGDAEIADEPFSLKAVVDNLPNPNLSAELNLDLNLSVVEQFIDPEAEMSGRMKIKATSYGRLKNPEAMTLLGSLEIEDLEYKSPDLEFPVDDLDAEIEFIGSDAKIGTIKADLGESDIELSGHLSDVSQYIFGLGVVERKPFFTGKLKSEYLDIDQLFPEEEEEVAVSPGIDSAVAVDTSFFFLPDFDAEGTFEVREGIYSLVAFEDLKGRFTLMDYVLHIDSANAKVYDGDLVGSAVVDIEDFENPVFQVDYSARGIQVNSFLSRFTSFENHVFGEINLQGAFSGTGSEPEDIIKTLRAAGDAEMNDGKLKNFELLQKLAGQFGGKVPAEETIRDLIGSYRVENQRVYFDDMRLKSSKGDWFLTGSVGFDGSLDYRGEVEFSSRSKGLLGNLGGLFGEDSGQIKLPFNLTGSYEDPKIELITSQLEKNADNKLKEEGTKLLDKLFKK